jgi:hypothetical protein
MTRALVGFLCALGCAPSRAEQATPDAAPFEVPACAAEPEIPCTDTAGEFYCSDTVGFPHIEVLASSDDSAATPEQLAASPESFSTGSLSVPDEGTLCFEGTLAAEKSTGSWAELILSALEGNIDENGACIRAALDARALGITAVEFDLDQVPDTRLVLDANLVVKPECPDPWGCLEGGVYTLFTHDRQDMVVLAPGTTRAPLEDFVGQTSPEPFDTRRIALFALRVVAADRPVSFAFCLSALRFLDARGREVILPARY